MLNTAFKTRGFTELDVDIKPELLKNLKDACDQLHGKYESQPSYVAKILSLCKSELERKVGTDLFYTGNYEFRSENDFYAYNLHHDCKGGFPFSNGSDELLVSFKTNYRENIEIGDNDYPIFRLALYLTDLRNYSGGTKLLIGSHKKYPLWSGQGMRQFAKLNFGKIFGLFARSINPTASKKPYTVVCFNARVYHSGHFIRYRLLRKLSMPWWFDNHIKRVMKLPFKKFLTKFFIYPFPEKRHLIFVDLAIKSPFAVAYQADRYLCGNPSMSEFLDEKQCARFKKESGFSVLTPWYLKMYKDEFDNLR